MSRYPRVSAPLRLGPVEVPNRLYMAPHGIALELPGPGPHDHFVPSEEAAHYYAERVRGGVGLVFHSTQLGPAARQSNLRANPWHPESVPHFARVAELVHEQGGRIMAEVWYASHVLKRWTARGPDAPVLGASAGQHWLFPGVRRAMGHDDIARYVADHAVVARRLREAGYDGVEVHASHGTLIEHFLSPYFNQREDEYGGSLENRMRILREALEAVRSELDGTMAVGIRINADELLDGGVDEAGTREILAALAPTGLLDFVDLDVSVEPIQQHLMTTTFFEPKLHNAERVARVSPAARPLPVLSTPGRLTRIQEAEELLASGAVDMVGAVRGLIAEPYLLRQAIDGRERRSRVCIAANHCAESGGSGGFGCAVNPIAGREEHWGGAVAPAPRTRRVVVVGGGPAGAEAALTAARRGHAVTLLERRERIGGGLLLWAAIPGREQIGTLPAFYASELAELGVEVRTGVEATAADVTRLAPDTVVVATGGVYATRGESAYSPRGIAGADAAIVRAPEPLLRGEATLSGRVIVVDEEGYHTAAGIAEMAALAGAEVELVTRKLTPLPGLAANLQLGYVLARLRAAGVTLSTSTFPARIDERSVTLLDTLTNRTRVVEDVDAVVLATMRLPLDGLAGALQGRVEHLYLIGDALAPRGLREATYEGHRFARAIGEDGAPRTVTETLFEPVPRLRLAGESVEA